MTWQPELSTHAADSAAVPGTASAASGKAVEPPAPMLVIISGPSGVGKDTIIDALQRRGRAPRDAEVDGVSYLFMSVDQFVALRDAGELLEANEVHGNWYGTPRAGVREALANGRHAILKIDVQGAQVVKESVADALLIFVVPPSLETLFQHLKARRTESANELEIRQRNAAIELAKADDYDYVVVNEENHVDLTAERIEEIIEIEERRGPRPAVKV
jgi:guanylate kinase